LTKGCGGDGASLNSFGGEEDDESEIKRYFNLLEQDLSMIPCMT